MSKTLSLLGYEDETLDVYIRESVEKLTQEARITLFDPDGSAKGDLNFGDSIGIFHVAAEYWRGMVTGDRSEGGKTIIEANSFDYFLRNPATLRYEDTLISDIIEDVVKNHTPINYDETEIDVQDDHQVTVEVRGEPLKELMDKLTRLSGGEAYGVSNRPNVNTFYFKPRGADSAPFDLVPSRYYKSTFEEDDRREVNTVVIYYGESDDRDKYVLRDDTAISSLDAKLPDTDGDPELILSQYRPEIHTESEAATHAETVMDRFSEVQFGTIELQGGFDLQVGQEAKVEDPRSGIDDHYRIWEIERRYTRTTVKVAEAVDGILHTLSRGTEERRRAEHQRVGDPDEAWIDPERDIGEGAIDSERIADGSVTAVKLEDGAVTTIKLEDGAVLEAKVGDEAITETKIEDDSITTPKLQANAVTAPKIQTNTITGAEFDRVVDGEVVDTVHILTLNADKVIFASGDDGEDLTTTEGGMTVIAGGRIETDTVTASHIASDTITAAQIATLDLDTQQLTISDDSADDDGIEFGTHTTSPPLPDATWTVVEPANASSVMFGTGDKPFASFEFDDGWVNNILRVGDRVDTDEIHGVEVHTDEVHNTSGDFAQVTSHNNEFALVPESDNEGYLGTSDNAWKEVHAHSIVEHSAPTFEEEVAVDTLDYGSKSLPSFALHDGGINLGRMASMLLTVCQRQEERIRELRERLDD